VAGDGGPGAGSGRDARALERVARGGVRSVAARPRGEKGEGRGGPGVGVPRGAREFVGSGPDRRVAAAAARAQRGRATCAARARLVEDRAGEIES
jgi:hypothetical protein